jgi:hypothetical protein
LGGIKLAASQTVAQEISNPLAILNICFVSRNGVHMLGIDQQDLITAFQQIENGTPIDARAFESHLFHMSLHEPVVKLSEPIGRRCKGTDRFLDGPDRAGSAADILRRFSGAHPNHNSVHTQLALALSFQM